MVFIEIGAFVTLMIFLNRRAKKKLSSTEISTSSRNYHKFGLISTYLLIFWAILMLIIFVVMELFPKPW
jgi:hypothetical protein